MSSLLRRVRGLSIGSASVAGREPPARELREAVLENLRRILWTSQGSVPAAPDLGVPDVGDMLQAGPKGQANFIIALRATIEKFEPRLHRVEIELTRAGEDQNVRIDISGELRIGRERRNTRFSATIEPSRRMTVT